MTRLPPRLPLLALLPALLFGAGLSPALAQTAAPTSPATAPTPAAPPPATTAPAPATPATTPPAAPAPTTPTPAEAAPATPATPAAPPTPATPVPASTDATPATFTLQDALNGVTASASYRQLQLTLAAAQAQAQAAQASTGFTAGVSGSLNTTATGSTDTTGASTSTSASVTATASLPVLPWATANLNAQTAARAYSVAQVTFAQATAALRSSAEQAYGRAVTAQLNLEIAGANLTLTERQLAQVTAFQANNNATVQSVQTAQAAVQTAQTALQSARNELGSARQALGTLTGRDLSAATFSTDLSGVLALTALPTVQAAQVAAQAFSPALASAQKAVTDAQASVTTAQRARRLPDATLSAQYGPGTSSARTGLSGSLNLQSGVASASYTQGFGSSGAASSLALGLSANFNVLDPAADGTLKVAQLQLQQAQAAVQVQTATVSQNVQDAYDAAQVAAQAISARQTSVTAYTTALDTVQARLAVGLSTETDLLNARIALAQAKRDLNTAQITALTSAAQLAALTGLTGAP